MSGRLLESVQTLLTGGILDDEAGPSTKKRPRKDRDESDEEQADGDSANVASASSKLPSYT